MHFRVDVYTTGCEDLISIVTSGEVCSHLVIEVVDAIAGRNQEREDVALLRSRRCHHFGKRNSDASPFRLLVVVEHVQEAVHNPETADRTCSYEVHVDRIGKHEQALEEVLQHIDCRHTRRGDAFERSNATAEKAVPRASAI